MPQITTFGCTYLGLYVHVMYCIVSYHGEKHMGYDLGLGKGCAKMDGPILTIYTSYDVLPRKDNYSLQSAVQVSIIVNLKTSSVALNKS